VLANGLTLLPKLWEAKQGHWPTQNVGPKGCILFLPKKYRGKTLGILNGQIPVWDKISASCQI